MLTAFVSSCLFLVCYLVYHTLVGGSVPFGHQGTLLRTIYFSILIPHTILAAAIVPMIIVTLRRAWLEKFDKHHAIARWTLPLWLCVSVTGVIVYLMVYQIYVPRK